MAKAESKEQNFKQESRKLKLISVFPISNFCVGFCLVGHDGHYRHAFIRLLAYRRRARSDTPYHHPTGVDFWSAVPLQATATRCNSSSVISGKIGSDTMRAAWDSVT